jgi:hypothetical protein
MLLDILDKKQVADGFNYSSFCQTVTEFLLFTRHILQVFLCSDAVLHETRCSGNQFIVVSLLFVEPPNHFLQEFRPMTLLPCFSYLDFDCALYLFDVIGHLYGFVSVVEVVDEISQSTPLSLMVEHLVASTLPQHSALVDGPFCSQRSQFAFPRVISPGVQALLTRFWSFRCSPVLHVTAPHGHSSIKLNSTPEHPAEPYRSVRYRLLQSTCGGTKPSTRSRWPVAV